MISLADFSIVTHSYDFFWPFIDEELTRFQDGV